MQQGRDDAARIRAGGAPAPEGAPYAGNGVAGVLRNVLGNIEAIPGSVGSLAKDEWNASQDQARARTAALDKPWAGDLPSAPASLLAGVLGINDPTKNEPIIQTRGPELAALTRPANLVGAVAPELSFAPEAGPITRVLTDIAANVAGGAGGDKARQAAKDAGLPEWAQDVAALGASALVGGVAGGATAGGLAGDVSDTGRAAVSEADQFGRGAHQDMRPYQAERGIRGASDDVTGAPSQAFSEHAPGTQFDFRYKVKSLDDLTTSHTDTFDENAKFPQELQPRDRDRAAAQQQVKDYSQNLDTNLLLNDFKALDRGAPIIGPDNLVESGNGRVMALRRARTQSPEQYQQYVSDLKDRAEGLGIDPKAIDGVKDPVLVRERTTPIADADRPSFTEIANRPSGLVQSATENAANDVSRISDNALASFTPSSSGNIEESLRAPANRDFVRSFVGQMSPEEVGTMVDGNGNLSRTGVQRVKAAMFAKLFPGETGSRVAERFFESTDENVKRVESGIFGAMPDLARSEGMIRSGERPAELSISEDLMKATDMLDRLRLSGMKVSDYLGQVGMFARELTPEQDRLLAFLDANRNSPAKIRETLAGYAERVAGSANPNQGSLFGADEMPAVSKSEMFDGAARAASAAEPTNSASGALVPPDASVPDVAGDDTGPRPAAPEAVPTERPAAGNSLLTDAELPRPLKGAAPRYGQQILTFGSDVDKALYIVGNPTTRSAQHDAYVNWLSDTLGMDPAAVQRQAAMTRQQVIGYAKARPGEEAIHIPSLTADPEGAAAPPTAPTPPPVETTAAPGAVPPAAAEAATPRVASAAPEQQTDLFGGNAEDQPFEMADAPAEGQQRAEQLAGEPPTGGDGGGTPPIDGATPPPAGGEDAPKGVLPSRYIAPEQPTGTIREAQMRPDAERFKLPSALDRAEDFHGQRGQYVPAGQRDALFRAAAQEQPEGIPGADKVPGVRTVQSKLTPAVGMPRTTYEALNAGDIARADVGIRLISSREELLAKVEKEFGALDNLNVELKDPAQTAIKAINRDGKVVQTTVRLPDLTDAQGNPVVGTFKDVFENAHDYKLTDAQQAVIDAWEQRNTREVNPFVRKDYGVEIGDFSKPARLDQPESWGRNQVFVPSVNRDESMMDMASSSPAAMATQGRMRERLFTSGRDRIAVDPNFVPETNARTLLAGLDNAKAAAAGNETVRAGIGGQIDGGVGSGLYEALPGQWVPDNEARAVKGALRQLDPASAEAKLVRASGTISQTVLGGSAEVLGTHGLIGFLAHPAIVAKSVIGGALKSVATGDLLRPFSREDLVNDLTNDPWGRDFAMYAGRALNLTRGTSEEFTGGLLSRIPGFKGVNEGAFNMLVREQMSIFKQLSMDEMARGVPEAEAKAAAMDNALRTVPMVQPTRAGLSPAGATEQRAPFTSISMIRQPAQLFGEGMTGLFKMGTGKQLSSSERLSARSLMNLTMMVAGASVTSAYVDARMRGADPEKAVLNVLTPGSGFMQWTVPGTGITFAPAGAFRNMALAVLPQPVKTKSATGIPLPGGMALGRGDVWLPFGGIVNYLNSRVAPGGQIAVGLIKNKDYSGNDIATGGFPLNIAQQAMYVGESMLPIGAQAPLDNLRAGDTPFQNGVKTAFQFIGEHAKFPSALDNRDLARDQAAAAAKLPNVLDSKGGVATKWSQLTGGQQQQVMANTPGLADKVKGLEAQSLAHGNGAVPDELRAYKAIDDEKVQAESAAWKNAPMKVDPATGQPVKDMAKFRADYNTIQQTAADKKIQADTDFKAFADKGTLPSDPGKAALVQWLDTIQQSKGADGKVDWEKQGQLEADLRKTLPPGAEKFIDDRGAGTHAPELDAWLQAKKYIQDSGYWNIQDKSIADVARSSMGSFPDVKAPTTLLALDKLQQQALNRRDPNLYQTLDAIKKAATQQSTAEQTQFREQNPNVDQALQLAYGYEPAGFSTSGSGITRRGGSSSGRRTIR